MKVFAFVNPKSGSRVGGQTLKWLKDHDADAIDLTQEKDIDGFLQKIKISSKKPKQQTIVIVAAGDGTISSVVDLLQKNKIDVPVVPFPLGTVNELAWNTGWGGYYSGLKLSGYFAALKDCAVANLDIWRADTVSDTGQKQSFHFQDFFSLGMDARIVHTVVDFQRRHPVLCRFRFLVILWYIVFGIHEAFFRRIRIGKYLQLSDGSKKMPCERAGIIHILNIPTSGGHTDYFGYGTFQNKPQPGYIKPSINDGILEVAATLGIRSFLKSVLKMGHVTRLAQVKELDIEVDPKFPQQIQLDGEKIEGKFIRIKIRHAGQQRLLLGPGRRRGC